MRTCADLHSRTFSDVHVRDRGSRSVNWSIFRANSPKRLVKLRDLLLSNRVREVIPSYLQRHCCEGWCRGISFFEPFLSIHGTHSWFFIAFVGGMVYYTWYKKNVLDKVSARLG
jgi:hypothetical protein